MASVNNLKVSVQQLSSLSTRFGSIANDTRRLTTNMLNLVNNSSSIWRGDAATAYKSKFNGLKNDMDKIYKAIDEYRNDLSKIASNYQSAEEANKGQAQSLNDDPASGLYG